jgi:predicted ferric reductase
MKIVEKIFENDTVTSVFVNVADQPSFRNRKPAQFATLQLPRGGGWSEAHPFTISDITAPDTVRFTIKKVGAFTSAVRDVAVGTPVQVKGPFGSFCGDLDRHDSVAMLAGGIGITPFLSVLRHYRTSGAPHPAVTLLWGNTGFDDAFSLDELSALGKDLGITVIHRISGTSSPVPRRAGVRMEQGLLSADFLKANVPLERTALYVCGSPGMKTYALNELASCGVDITKIKFEVIQWNPPAAAR